MIFNKIQVLRNRPIKIQRDQEDEYFYVQGPTIGQVYDNELLFFTTQLFTMEHEDLFEYLGIENKDYTRIEIINMVIESADKGPEILESMQKIVLDTAFNNGFLFVGDKEMSENEAKKISKLLKIIMGQATYQDSEEDERELSDMEKRMKELEEKIQKKKGQKKQTKAENDKEEKSILEDIMIALTYEFGFDIEKMMGMNYFTLLWYYSYTSKIHVYRINQFAIGSGMVKKINTDYFTGLK